jgi:hypothetical protein
MTIKASPISCLRRQTASLRDVCCLGFPSDLNWTLLFFVWLTSHTFQGISQLFSSESHRRVEDVRHV